MADDLDLATRNAGALWRALARARGHSLVERAGFLAVDGDARAGLRVLMLSAAPSADDVAEVAELVRAHPTGTLCVEDPYGSLDLTDIELVARQLPVMSYRGDGAPGPVIGDVTSVQSVGELAALERVVVDGFPVEYFQPYVAGEALPPGLLDDPSVRCYLIARDGVTAGACLTILDADVTGVYWVTTLPEFRSRGVARSLMHAILDEAAGRPVTLSASRAGRPLYDSLGFATLAMPNWWSRPT
jgi:GNAT superfamily N-acetyltransferase